MKKYYSSYKEYYRRKRLKITFKIVRRIVKFFFPKNEFVWKCEKPDENEPLFFVANHGKLYPPLAFLFGYNKIIRTWSHSYLLNLKEVKKIMFEEVLKNRKPKILLYPLTFLILPVIVWAFRGFEPIPVYHNGRKILTTFNKSIDTMENNIDQVIFPENVDLDNRDPSLTMANEYLFNFNKGFINIAKTYYENTKKCLKFYPSYVCQELRKVLIGEPIIYNPEISWPKQKKDICYYLENEIKNLANSLPIHKIVIAG